MLAMDVNDNAWSLTPRGVLRLLASKLAPTGTASAKPVLYEPCPHKIVIYSELARDYLKRHGESHYEH
ncbi:hypothetical protein PSJE_14875 [Pseudomonas jessenii]|nr:hypothetical protein PSJE_14875 [Pseudomonas jessenii]